MMKKLLLILVFCLALAPVGVAEDSSTDRFLSSLSDTWDSFLDMADDAGKGVSRWAEDAGVTDFTRDTVDGITAWAQDSGLTEWTRGAVSDISAWLEDSGIAQWTDEAAGEIRRMYEENRPEVEAWLNQAGEEVRRAWDALLYPEDHTAEELEAARETVVDALEEAQGE